MNARRSKQNEHADPLRVELACAIASAVTPSPRVMQAAAMFGLGIESQRSVTVWPTVKLTLARGQLIFVTGTSGGGKSTFLRLILQALTHTSQHAPAPAKHTPAQVARRLGDTSSPIPVIDFTTLDLQTSAALVDSLGDLPLDRGMKYLSLAGLNDAFVMLRRPTELSDGQRYRWRLAQGMARVDALPPTDARSRLPRAVVLADEFGATLDRHTAAVISTNVRKWVRRSGVCFIAATTHDDLLEPLDPDLLVEKGFGTDLEIVTRPHDRSRNTRRQGASA